VIQFFLNYFKSHVTETHVTNMLQPLWSYFILCIDFLSLYTRARFVCNSLLVTTSQKYTVDGQGSARPDH